MSNEQSKIADTVSAALKTSPVQLEGLGLQGCYTIVCHDKDGLLKWEDTIDNLTTNIGRKTLNDVFIDQVLVTPTTVCLGLWVTIAGAPAVADTMTSHAGWKEIGNANAPTYTVGGFGVRAIPAFSAATDANPSVKATSAPSVHLITSAGPSPIDGAFLVVGGTTAIDNTTGILFSAGAFTAGTKTVTSGDTLSVSWSLSTA
jgi:hypothetical protein